MYGGAGATGEAACAVRPTPPPRVGARQVFPGSVDWDLGWQLHLGAQRALSLPEAVRPAPPRRPVPAAIRTATGISGRAWVRGVALLLLFSLSRYLALSLSRSLTQYCTITTTTTKRP